MFVGDCGKVFLLAGSRATLWCLREWGRRRTRSLGALICEIKRRGYRHGLGAVKFVWRKSHMSIINGDVDKSGRGGVS